MKRRLAGSRPWAQVGVASALAAALIAGDAAADSAQVPAALVPGGTGSPALMDPAIQNAIARVPIWKRITLGTHAGVNAVRKALETARMGVGDSADEILGRPAFVFSRTTTQLDLVVLAPSNLGFAGESPTLAEIYHRAAQLGLEQCPGEAGPLLRLQYINQPVGEFLHIAMQPIATYGGALVDLTVANGGAGLLLLGGDGSPDVRVSTRAKFVFVRPSRVAMPNASREHPGLTSGTHAAEQPSSRLDGTPSFGCGRDDGQCID